MSIDAPARAFRFTLRLDADSRDDLTRALENIAMRIALNELTSGVSGGYGSGYSYELLSDPSQTHDKYFADLNAWLAAKRDAENSRTPAKPDDAPIHLCARKGGCVCTGHFERDRSVCRHWKRDAEQEAKS